MLRRKGFTLIELLVVISIIALLIGILLPALGAARRTARQMANSTQLRGIQQGMVTFAQSNKKGGNDGFFPMRDSSGRWASVPAADDTNGTYGGTAIDDLNGSPAAAVALMLNSNAFTPEYVLNPADSGASEVETDPAGTAPFEVSISNFSYAMLVLDQGANSDPDPTADDSPPDTRANEWKETLNTSAVVMCDINTGSGAEIGEDISSVWTEEDEGDWRGTVTRNDNSTSFETTPKFDQLKYGNGASVEEDHLFANVDGGGDDQDEWGGATGITEESNAYMGFDDELATAIAVNQDDAR